ncbi:rho guanine nucleotide exchange factor 19 isoform X1 [Alligator mississippiensis]|uniref:rho guanine nucleotide exchange factor 19 isoform X1 n=1 Tax=Alligator mississippiensis TaxID=8496 RepID=UPI0028773757|nr:rho guanine nucleotide exchange factor 19 isoform X1 [Alligator mississippiensis]
MDFFCQKRTRSDSQPKATLPVKRRASCPLTRQGTRVDRRQDRGSFLAGLFRARPPAGARWFPAPGLELGAEESVPLLGGSSEGEDQPEHRKAPGTLPSVPAVQLSEGSRLQVPGPGHKALHSSLDNLPEAMARSLQQTRRKEKKEKWRVDPQGAEMPLLSQDYWMKQLQAVGPMPKDWSFRVDASLTLAGLLSSSLLSAAFHAAPHDYGVSWRDLPEVKSRRLLESITPRQHHLQEALFEVITSEATYLRSLGVAVSHFRSSQPLQAALAVTELHQLFSNLPQVKGVSDRFLLELEEELDKDIFLAGLGAVVLRHCPAFRRVYIPYVTNQMYQEQLMQKLMRENGRFLQVLRRLEGQPVCRRQPLKSFLVLPFQRITRLKMLLESILKLAPAGSELEESIGAALKAVGEIVSECNESVRRMKQTEELVLLEKQVEFLKTKAIPLISRGRWLVRAGALTHILLQDGVAGSRPRLSRKPIHLHLFSDLLLLSRRREDGRFSVQDYANANHVKAELLEADLAFRLRLSQNHRGAGAEFLLRAASASERQEWISLIARHASPAPS